MNGEPEILGFAELIVIDEEGQELSPYQRDILMRFMEQHIGIAGRLHIHVGPIHDDIQVTVGDISSLVNMAYKDNEALYTKIIPPNKPFWHSEQWRRKNRWRRS